jgi:hypothetical protein
MLFILVVLSIALWFTALGVVASSAFESLVNSELLGGCASSFEVFKQLIGEF